VNTSVTHVNLESNLLTKGAKGLDISGVQALSEMLKENTTLVYLNMWRCGVASEGGHQIVTGMGGNDTIIFLELGHNGLTQNQERRLAEKLDDNKDRYEAEQEVRRAEEGKASAEAAVAKAEADLKAKQEGVVTWMEEQKLARAMKKRQEMEAAAEEERKQAEIRRVEEEVRAKKLAEEEAAKAAKKAKKKGKKK
jgi:hypothetical protein